MRPADEPLRTPALPLGAVPPETRRDLGKYRLIAEIGRGGMGVVYLGVSRGVEGFRKLVVVKELRPEFLGEDACVAMFMDEARVAARLNHPNIVQTIEVGEDRARHFIAMEYLDGQPLHQLVQRALAQSNRLSLRMHLGILIDVLTALEYAHELTDYDGTPLGVVHRDVSPHNVIVTYEGQTKLVDFGISKTAKSAGGEHETQAGVVRGKMRYMAPEQAAGGPLDRRADIFAVGAMLWEAIVGRRAWEAQTDAAILQSLTEGKVPRVRDAWPDVDPELAGIVDRAMSVDPSARYATAGAMRADLERYVVTRNVLPNARSLGATVSRLFSEDRKSRRALIDEHVRALTEAMPGHRQSQPPDPVSSRPASLRDHTLASPSEGPPSSRPPATSVSLTPRPVTSPGPRPAGPASAEPFWRGRIQGAVPALAAVGFGAVLAVTAVMADRIRSSDGRIPAAAGVAKAAVSVADASRGAPTLAPALAAVSAAAAPPRLTHVTLMASPASAQLYLDDVPIENPYVADAVSDTIAHRLRVQAPGFETKTRALTFAEDIQLEISLLPNVSPASLAVTPAARRPVVRASPPPAPTPPPQCEPPYVVDSTGRKHWKAECLDSGPLPAGSSNPPDPSVPRQPSSPQPKPIEMGSPYGAGRL